MNTDLNAALGTTLTVLGAGSAFAMDNFQSNFVIKRNGLQLLVDCGSDIRFSMHEQGLKYLDINAVYVSHAHADHIGGLEWLAFCSYFDPRYTGKPKIFAERDLMRSLWDKSLAGGLEGLEGVEARLSTYFDVHPVPRNGSFEWQGIKFDIVQSIHVSAKYAVLDSYGLMWTDPATKQRVFLTTDVQFCPETSMKAYYKEADIILHDCETAPFQSGVHAHYNMLKTLPDDIKAKMHLYHYQDNVATDFDAWQKKAQDDGFIGFLRKGDTMKFEPTKPMVWDPLG